LNTSDNLKKKLVILGSTGSIGTQALEIVRQHPDKFEVLALTANSQAELLARQVNEFNPNFAAIVDSQLLDKLASGVNTQTHLKAGYETLIEYSTLPQADIILNSIVGFAGFAPTFAALKAGKRVALANKESLVVGGELIHELLKTSKGELIPVDSEHSAMLQCMVGEPKDRIEKIVITASGGPFRKFTTNQMAKVTVEQALNHPNWDMGAKITIDSSTMMNKGLEIIEAHWLFDLPVHKIEPVIHPQSIIHSIVTYVDGSSKAQLGPPDMKVPIIYALSYPDRFALETPRLNWSQVQELTFEAVDFGKFPCVRLAIESIKAGHLAPAILNAANEVAVQRFLNREIVYIDIPKIVETSLEKLSNGTAISLQTLHEIDIETREFASRI
jgi:1-deoxy-D-xylulose-5-phosphate reductoisomerase